MALSINGDFINNNNNNGSTRWTLWQDKIECLWFNIFLFILLNIVCDFFFYVTRVAVRAQAGVSSNYIRLGEGVRYSKDLKQPVTPGNATDDVP